MAYTTPRTWADETIVNADDLNVEIRDNVSALYSMAAYPSRNLLYNGAMQISQRGTSTASITSSAYYTADRWQTTLGSLGTWTQSVENDAPANTGLRRSLKMLCTTASASPAAGGVLLVEQGLEGFDVQRTMKGSSGALPLTLSFYVKANVTGTYVVEIRDNDNTRHICRTYTIAASGTWERKEISIPADTTGAFDNDANGSLYVQFWLGAGSTFNSGTLATSWASATNANRAVGQTNLASATSNYWQVTGVQLETGAVATPFEFLPYGEELRRCQRYYNRLSPNSSGYALFGRGQCSSGTGASIGIQHPVPLRVATTAVETTGNTGNYAIVTATGVITALTNIVHSSSGETTPWATQLGVSVASGMVAGNGTAMYSNLSTAAFLGFSAEL